MTIKPVNEAKVIDILNRLVTDGEYNDDGNYVLTSDIPGTQYEGCMPSIIKDALELLREIGVHP